jgi:uncharacterized phage protein (TIGR02218 family)
VKAIGAILKSHLAGEVTTLATLWKVTRRDAQVFCFTDHDADIDYQGLTYTAATGYSASAIRTSDAMDVDNMEVEGMLSSETITDDDLLAGLWDFAEFTIMRVNYADLTMGHEVLRAGTMGNVRSGRQHFAVELRGMTQPLQQPVGRVYTPACDADLGDARCGISLAGITVAGTVTAASTQSAFIDSGRGEAAGWFNFGLLTFTSGDNTGYAMEVKTFSAGAFVLQQGMPNPIQAGDTYSVYAGCDKLLSTCASKFSNVVNFRGFPHVPGTDRMMSGR